MYHWFVPQHILNLHFVVVVVAVPCPETPSSDVTPEGKYVVGPPYTLTPGSHPGFPSYLSMIATRSFQFLLHKLMLFLIYIHLV